MVALQALTEEAPPGATQVLMPSFTFIATVSAVVWAGLEPVFCDVDREHWHLSPDELESVVEDRSSSIACLLPCSTFGTAPPLSVRARWEELGRASGVPVLVDSAPGFGSVDDGGMELGAQGNAEIFSFHATKPLAIGEGGAISARDERLASRLGELTNFGLDEERELVANPGLNARMSEMHAAIGLAALDRHDEVLRARRTRAAALAARLGEQLEFQPNSETSAWQTVPALARDTSARDAILKRAKEMRIELRTYFQPLHRMAPLTHHARAGSLEATDELASRVLTLPMANDLNEEELELICSCVLGAS
jgi:dTDP-4-amino-4,6-dideoxygalactose transaminase